MLGIMFTSPFFFVGGGGWGGEAVIEIKCKDKIQGNVKGFSFKIYIHVNHS